MKKLIKSELESISQSVHDDIKTQLNCSEDDIAIVMSDLVTSIIVKFLEKYQDKIEYDK